MMNKIKFVLWLALFLVLTYYFGSFLIWMEITFKPMTEASLKIMKFSIRVVMVVFAIKAAFIFTFMEGKRK